MYENTNRIVKTNVIGERNTVVDGINVSYKIYQLTEGYEHDNIEWCWVDSKGNVYVSPLPTASENHRQKFADLIAYHERLEFDWLTEQGLPSPRYNTKPNTRESEIACEIHDQVHYLELVAAKNMGILDEFVAWRPSESVTEEFYKKLKQDEG